MKVGDIIHKISGRGENGALPLALCAGLALFWIVFLWNFWERGVFALGINATVFFALFLWLFVWALRRQGHYVKADLVWIIPIALVILSYAIYDNPFLKAFSLMTLLFIAGIFYNHAFSPLKKTQDWDFAFILGIIGRYLAVLAAIPSAVTRYLNALIPSGSPKKRVIVRVILGMILFLLIALTVFIPLLSSADPVFGEKVKGIYDWFKEIISLPYVYKLLVFIAFSVGFLSVFTAWAKKFEVKETAQRERMIDPIISGIALGGILVLYLLFIWVQFNRLWVGALPIDFGETEVLVKSGFWQLLFLSIINIVIYFFTYRKTVSAVQKILGVFTIASLLLLASAGYRMGLYVTHYGLSYEKLFASYTVLYCAAVFVWLLARLFAARRANILKFLIVLFIWMYAALTIFPVEQFILRTNVALAQREGSRIRLFEMTMLSPDALSLVKEYKAQGILREKVDYLAREGEQKSEEQFDWQPWIEKQEKRVGEKTWYELNLVNMISRRE